ncbi:MAG: carboxypeptidase regulatory-like domain-containing protein, partial [Cytophagaceae bacterium]|nr:carboxypeptidase regulatory-like domain-containing protein [Cytophagaceae bacterium]
MKAPVSGNVFNNIAKIKDVDQYDPDSDPTNNPDKDNDGSVGSVDNSSNDPVDPQDEDDADDEKVLPQVADLELVKTVSNATPNVGDVVTFTIKVDNKGPQAATNVVIEDTVPNGYETISAISGGGTLAGSTITWNVANIAANGSTSLTFTAKVKAPVSGNVFNNIAKIKDVDQYDPDSDPTNNPDKDNDGSVGSVDNSSNDPVDPQDEDDADDEKVVPKVADLKLVKLVDDKYPKVGSTVTFTVKVTNEGPDVATNVLVEDKLPNGYSNPVNISNSGSASGNTVSWNVPSIAPNASVELKVTVTVGQPAQGISFVNLAEIKDVDQYDPDSNPGNGADTNNNGKVGSEDNDDSKDLADEDDGDHAYVIPTASLGDLVFEDKNGNGIQDPTEPGVSGVTVKLTGTDRDGLPVSLTATTDINGKYLFEDLVPGNYVVEFVKPLGYTGSDKDQGTDDAKDSDADKLTGITGTIVLSSGDNNLTVDAGIFKPAKLGDYVWEDKNYNGVQDSGESPIQGVVVKLLDGAGQPAKDADGNVVASTTTDATGKYQFSNLKPGVQYVVEFTKPSGYEPTAQDKGGDDTKDSDANTTTGKSQTVVLESGENNPTIDAGYFKPATIGDFVFEDKNGNGIQDPTEPGIAGVTVKLNGSDGQGNPVTLTTTTDATGKYEFTNVKPGTYTVTFTKPADYTTTDPNQGTDDTKDSDADKTTGTTQSVTVVSGEENKTLDAGYFKPAKLGDYVWEDKNYNGVQDSGESPIQGVVVKLLDGAGQPAKDADGNVVASTTTDATGKYQFSNLKPGVQYVVEFTKPSGYEPTAQDKGGDDTKDSDANTTTGKSQTVVLESGENNPTIDAGYFKPATIGDFVFEDKNGNGIQDPTEPGIAGVTVKLNGSDGQGNPVTLTTTTDGTGKYEFTNVKPGTYTVTFTKPADYTTTDPNQGTDDTKDSDADKTTGTTQSVTVVSGEENKTLDAGYFKPAKLGDYVWEDTNKNGVQDSGEPGISGATVKLTGTTSTGAPVSLTTTTDANGKYEFTNLAPGSYTVEFVTPGSAGDYTNSPENSGSDDTKDSDANVVTGKTSSITLQSGDDNKTVDAGFYKCIKSAEFNYPNTPICYNQPITLSPIFGAGSQAGVFSSSPVLGSALNTSTGVINVAVAASGSYTITNT